MREQIAKDVEKIINFDKRIRVDNILIDATEYGLRIEAELTYLPLDLKDTLRLDFDRRNSVN